MTRKRERGGRVKGKCEVPFSSASSGVWSPSGIFSGRQSARGISSSPLEPPSLRHSSMGLGTKGEGVIGEMRRSKTRMMRYKRERRREWGDGWEKQENEVKLV